MKQGNESSVYSRDVGFDLKIEYNADGYELYVGIAEPGSATSAEKWQIYKMSYDASNRPTTRRYANSTDGLTQIWDNRASLNYVDI